MRRPGRKFREYGKDAIGTWSNSRGDRVRLLRNGDVQWRERDQKVWGRLHDWPCTIAQVHEAAEMQAFFRDQGYD